MNESWQMWRETCSMFVAASLFRRLSERERVRTPAGTSQLAPTAKRSAGRGRVRVRVRERRERVRERGRTYKAKPKWEGTGAFLLTIPPVSLTSQIQSSPVPPLCSLFFVLRFRDSTYSTCCSAGAVSRDAPRRTRSLDPTYHRSATFGPRRQPDCPATGKRQTAAKNRGRKKREPAKGRL